MPGNRIVMVGAGSAVFSLNLVHDFVTMPGLDGMEIVLVDVDDGRLRVVETLARRFVAERGADLRFERTADRREALAGADFVINTVAVGGHDAWLSDVQIPARHGYHYAIGDTIGPGGMFRAFRIMPVLLGIAADMEQLCPQAWLINFANPLTVNCQAIDRYSSIRFVGLCHGLHYTVKQLAERLGLRREEINARGAGVNHFVWLTDFTWRGRSAYPLLDEHLAANPTAHSPVTSELYRIHGLYPCNGDEHLAEFLPHYTSELAGRGERFGLRMDYVPHEIARLRGQLDHLRELAADSPARVGDDMADTRVGDHLSDSGETAAQIIAALRHDRPGLFTVNVASRGSLPGIPDDAVVEVTALVDGTGVHPVVHDRLPAGIRAQLLRIVGEHDLITEAAVHGDRDVALQALLANPATQTVAQAEAVLEDMFEHNRAYLPQFKF